MKKISDIKAFELLKRYGIPLVEMGMGKDLKQITGIAKRVGYPVVIKVSSPDIIHKTDEGGIILDIKSDKELEKAYNKIMERVKKKRAKLEGILVQKMHRGKREVIIGCKMDSQFGHVIMFGIGGIFVEVLKDITFRLVPLEKGDAWSMVRDIKSVKILEGVRGEKPVNFKALEDCIQMVSDMISQNRDIQELDINPLFVDEKGVAVADIRIFKK